MNGTLARPYRPRLDQIEAVMARSGCSYQQAVEVCVASFQKWRDTPRKWHSVHSSVGGYFVVEDR